MLNSIGKEKMIKPLGIRTPSAGTLPALSFLCHISAQTLNPLGESAGFDSTGEEELHKIQYFLPFSSTNTSTACNYSLGSSQGQCIPNVREDILGYDESAFDNDCYSP